MPSPAILNEEALIEALNPECPTTPDGFREVLKFVIVDCFDRDIKREEFVDVVSRCIELEHVLGRLLAMAGMRYTWHRHKLKTPSLDEQTKILGKEVVLARQALMDKMKLVAECKGSKEELS